MDHAIDSADLYFQVSREESWALEDGIVKEGSASIEQGVGVRAIAGEKTGFAYSDEILPPALRRSLARRARHRQAVSPARRVQAWRASERRTALPADRSAASLDDDAKVRLARARRPRDARAWIRASSR